MNVLLEIRRGFANLDHSGRMLAIEGLPENCPAWVFREGEVFGVAVELPADLTLSEGFAGARLRTVKRVIEGEIRHFLRLESSTEWLRNEFGVICEHMVTPGADQGSRLALLADPLAWWERWRHLLGNALVNRTSYDTLAELLVIERLVNSNVKFDWRGPCGASVDIQTPAEGFEVKSTISRYDSRVHIAGQFQLALGSGQPLSLVHFRFEPSLQGESIDAVCKRLVMAGVRNALLEEPLARCGLEVGCSARKETFKVLGANVYTVDEYFPKVAPESFVGGVLPAGVVHLEYQVDLSALPSRPFD
ncbi:PD-(D/E)XK motif protein [Pseudomonas asiatica]|uniref:PD-(D/E)XK motif protein n=1 Tax=Pseudomonas asiatica TaxID=2219225 RepID=UPI002DB93B62|nr:PD-(D/E)XK motif protein [Pseudomonas asiatica]MEB6588390.1 PD-(D/E)XK motif protein [Pseudomonas asiatica]